MAIALSVVSVLLGVALGLCALLDWQKRHLGRQVEQLRQEIHREQLEQQGVIAELRAQVRQYEQAGQQFKEAQQHARDAFKSLASDALRQSGEQFLQLAAQSFEGQKSDVNRALDERKAAVESMVKPIRESLERYGHWIEQVESARKQAYGSLTRQLELMKDDQRLLRDETSHLVQALKHPGVRGRWGEVQLRRVAELAGMIPYCDFFEQRQVDSNQSILKPDMTVRLPSQRTIVIDAKTPIDAFLSSIEAKDETQRQQLLAQHVRNIEAKVRELADKNYQAQFDRSPDFVVLFIPGESFLHAAVQVKPSLIETSLEKNVLIATPTTLIALLKAVALGWREQQVADNAQKISELGRQLHERLVVAVEHVERMGASLQSTVEQYNRFVGSLETRVMSSARRFERLGATSNKQLSPQIKPIDLTPRSVRPTVDNRDD